MKKSFLMLAAATLLLVSGLKAQTNLQVFYDFSREHVTTTLEGFYNDNWGNTFFFIDYDYNTRDADDKVYAPNGTYFEIARCLNFWQDNESLSPFSLHLEYNGGVYTGYTINSAFLGGVDYFLHNGDFSNTLNLKVLYKNIAHTSSDVPMQLTAVWGMQDIFGVAGLRFSGFADFWWEDHTLLFDNSEDPMVPEDSKVVFISEPQLWYNVGQHFDCPNLNVGGEVELSYDFGTVQGFKVRPCLGVKWNF
ncbi:MAG: DUF5020 family protein [Bacteroidales bacterium]|nr:DUF5020 family protein [Bacteroidales bacterium]